MIATPEVSIELIVETVCALNRDKQTNTPDWKPSHRVRGVTWNRKPPTVTLVVMRTFVLSLYDVSSAKCRSAASLSDDSAESQHFVPLTRCFAQMSHMPFGCMTSPRDNETLWPRRVGLLIGVGQAVLSCSSRRSEEEGEWPDLEITAGFYSWKLHPT